jgi:hypothetical protein
MRSEKWQKIVAARELLQLDDEASQVEIKKAYRRLARKCHPDLQHEDNGDDCSDMRNLTEAYKILLDYCLNFRVPLVLTDDSEPLDDEDWWLSRFGEDPLWSKRS